MSVLAECGERLRVVVESDAASDGGQGRVLRCCGRILIMNAHVTMSGMATRPQQGEAQWQKPRVRGVSGV